MDSFEKKKEKIWIHTLIDFLNPTKACLCCKKYISLSDNYKNDDEEEEYKMSLEDLNLCSLNYYSNLRQKAMNKMKM